MDSFTYTNPQTGKKKSFNAVEIKRLNDIADNQTEYAKYVDAAKTDEEKKKRVDLIKEFKFQRGDDLSRLSPQAVLGAADTIGLGYGLEGISAGLAAYDALIGKSNFKDAYNKYLDFAEGERDRFADKYQGQALVSDLAGGLLTGGAALKGVSYLNPLKVKGAKNIYGKGLNLATEGAGLGALYGSGYDSDDRLRGAQYGAAFGGAFNPVAVGGSQIAAKIAEPVVESAGRKLAQGKNIFTDKVKNPIRKAFNKDPIVPDTIMEDAKTREALGNIVNIGGGRADVETNLIEGMPLASNPNVLSEVRPIFQQTTNWNNFKNEILQNADTSVTQAYDTIIDSLGNLQGRARKDGELFVDYVNRVSKENSKKAKKLYEDAALKRKLDDNFAYSISQIFDNPTFNQLSDVTKRSIRAITVRTRDNKTVRAFDVDDTGIVLNDGVDFKDLDHLSIDKLYRKLRDARKESFKFGGDRVDGEIINENNLLSNIDDALRTYSDDIGNLRSTYSKNFEIDEATDDGYKLWRKEKPEEFVSELRRLKASEDQDAYQGFVRGAMRKISEQLRGSSKTSFLRRLGDNDSNDNLMFRELFPDESVDDVIRQINTTNEFNAAASVVKEKPFTAQQLGRADRGMFNDRITKDSIINRAINDAIPQDLNEGQKNRLMNLLLERAPKNITDNLDKPGYPELFNEFLRRNVAAELAVISQR